MEAQLLQNDNTLGMDVKPQGRVTLEECLNSRSMPLILVSKYAKNKDQDHGK